MTVVLRPSRPTVRRAGVLVAAVLGLLVTAVLSLTIGSSHVPWEVVLKALGAHDGSAWHVTIRDLRVPRTLLGILVGAALAVAGALMQGLTRNPLADPGLLGVNAGAGFGVALGVAFLGVTRIDQYLVFAFAGAIIAAVVVYAIASQGRSSPTPLRLTLVGLALGAVLMGLARTLALLNVQTFDRMRFWGAGTITDRPPGTVETIWPWIIVGLVIAVACARPVNAMSLGDDVARAVGVRVGLARLGVVVAVTMLCGAATAAAGPIAFVGLMVPHIVRWVTGPDYRWIVVVSLFVGPAFLLAADILGRVIVAPGELQVGVVTGLVGAPLLVALVHWRRAVAL